MRGDTVVGRVEVAARDAGMNVLSGRFIPEPGYEEVRAVFQRFAAECEGGDLTTYHRERDALALVVIDEKGAPQSRIVHILDFQAETPGTDLEAELLPS